MPYIKQKLRDEIDADISELIEGIVNQDETQQDGMLNYTITKLLAGLYEPNYFNLNRAIGVLECVKQEFYRRVVAPYEEIKRRENGDI